MNIAADILAQPPRLRRFGAMVGGIALFALPSISEACSVGPKFRQPTNFELVKMADAVVVGTVVGGSRPSLGSTGKVAIRPSLVLKGAVRGVFWIDGSLAGSEIAFPSDPRELELPHPWALSGSCIRYYYQPASRVLVFLRADPKDRRKRLNIMSVPFGRVAEDVGASSPWTTVVREYTRIAALPVSRQRAMLTTRRQAYEALGTRDGSLIANELHRAEKGSNQMSQRAVQRSEAAQRRLDRAMAALTRLLSERPSR